MHEGRGRMQTALSGATIVMAPDLNFETSFQRNDTCAKVVITSRLEGRWIQREDQGKEMPRNAESALQAHLNLSSTSKKF